MKPYFQEKIKESKPTLVVFEHAAMQDAVEVRNLVRELSARYGGRINITSSDTSYNRHAIREYKINAYPTWIIFREGEELMRESGSKTVSELSQLIERAF